VRKIGPAAQAIAHFDRAKQIQTAAPDGAWSICRGIKHGMTPGHEGPRRSKGDRDRAGERVGSITPGRIEGFTSPNPMP